jgi:hypothetical protein
LASAFVTLCNGVEEDMNVVNAASLLLIGGLLPLVMAAQAKSPTRLGEEIKRSGTMPQLVETTDSSVTLRCPGQTPHALAVGQVHRNWELLAVLKGDEPIAVLENHTPEENAIVYLSRSGAVASLSKAAASLNSQQQEQVFPLSHATDVLAAQKDVLGQEALAHRDSPSYEDLVGLLPTLRGYTFLGTPESGEKVIVWPDGRLGLGIHNHNLTTVLFDPSQLLHVPIDDKSARGEALIGGYLPAIDYSFLNRKTGQGFEEIAFSFGQNELATYVRLRPTHGEAEYWKLPGPQRLDKGADFYKQLLSTAQVWSRFFDKGMKIDIPEHTVTNASKAAIVRALVSQVGLHPKYGVGSYAEAKHDTFPPTVIQLVECLLDWGFIEQAKGRLGYYLANYVKQDGTFDYYGPALSEYGQIMALAARYVRVTGDKEWLKEHTPELKRIAQYLITKIHESREKYPQGSLYHGILWGSGEADTASDRQFYFSGSIWCWRGLHDLAQVMATEASLNTDSSEAASAKEIAAEASHLRTDTLSALNRSFQRSDPTFLPPVAGDAKPFASMTESEFSSYTNYRYWLEMLSGGLLPLDMSRSIIWYRENHGGEVGATTRFEDHLDDWTYANYARGLLEDGDIHHYLLGFYGHLAYNQTPGTYTAYEEVAIRGDSARDYVADYCVPAQVVTPQMLRWMLAWEPWDSSELWLGYAVPSRWLKTGFSAYRMPTAWGLVDLKEQQSGDSLTINVGIISSNPELSVYLPIGGSLNRAPPKISVDGASHWEYDASYRAVKLSGTWNQATVKVMR